MWEAGGRKRARDWLVSFLIVCFSLFMLYVAWKRGLPQKFARFVLFYPINKRSFNFLCVLDLLFKNASSQLCLRLLLKVFVMNPPVFRCVAMLCIACGPNVVATLRAFRAKYYLWCIGWLKLLGWLAARKLLQVAESSVSWDFAPRFRNPELSKILSC